MYFLGANFTTLLYRQTDGSGKSAMEKVTRVVLAYCLVFSSFEGCILFIFITMLPYTLSVTGIPKEIHLSVRNDTAEPSIIRIEVQNPPFSHLSTYFKRHAVACGKTDESLVCSDKT
jgi:hypothetical protein